MDKTQRLIPLRRGVLFPGTMMTLPVGRPRSVAALEQSKVGQHLVIAFQRDPRTEHPVAADLHPMATLARIHRVRQLDDGSYRVMLEGLRRVQLDGVDADGAGWTATYRNVENDEDGDTESALLAETLKEHVSELAAGGGSLAQALIGSARPGNLADRIASALDLEHEKELSVLLTLDVTERLRSVVQLVKEAAVLSEMKQKIQNEVRSSLGKHQRDVLLREQLKAIKKELGEDDPAGDKKDELSSRLKELDLPEEVREVVDRELNRMSSLPAGHPEFNVARNYLELIADLPWNERVDAIDDIDAVAKQLDADHHGLEDVKKRILEHMAVLKLSGNQRGTILGLAGPPGVGKTSLGQSIADATGRPFVRIALGGVRDEAEIRGHRRTYVGAIPGRVLSALRKVKVKNPVILLDEVDKLGRGWAGDPEAALLELLDPEQNGTFTDHYLELPFDLSEVMFICTANDLGQLSAPLRDRLEIVSLGGYTPNEKLAIARHHLIDKQLEEHAIGPDALEFSDEGLEALVGGYTREAGVRQLKREIGRVCRGVALEVARAADGKVARVRITPDNLDDYLGKKKFFDEVAERTSVPGVATGLAWTPVGGDILFIETSRMPGKGALQTTGQLGDVMKESARAALTYVRANAEKLGVDPAFLESSDLHIHVPAGAVPKDGPSAGVTMFTALTSLLTGRRVRSDTAMTGEATLRGRVLPVGGIKAKVLAAHRAGVTRVILPKRNERDLDDVPTSVRESMTFFPVEDMSEALEVALEPVGSDEAGESSVVPTTPTPGASPDGGLDGGNPVIPS